MGNKLRDIRVERGWTQEQAAEAMGVSRGQLIKLERGERRLTADYITRAARAFDVQPGDILGQDMVPIVGRAGANPDGTILYAAGDEPGDFAPIPPGGSERSRGLEVDGHSMPGVAEDGSLIYYEDRRDPPSDDMLGEVLIVAVDTGEVMVKRLLRGSERGLFDLESVNGPIRRDARVEWAARISAIIPPWKARQIIVRGTL